VLIKIAAAGMNRHDCNQRRAGPAMVNKKAEVVRVYLPPDANCLLSVTDHCLRSRNYVNLIVAGKQPAPQWLTMDESIKHCTGGLGIWEWASNDQGSEPDVGHGLLRRCSHLGDPGRCRTLLI
jgi:phosphoketolase